MHLSCLLNSIGLYFHETLSSNDYLAILMGIRVEVELECREAQWSQNEIKVISQNQSVFFVESSWPS